jgi:hypothetical protein
MIEIYSLDGKKLGSWKNLHAYALMELSERLNIDSHLSHRLNTIYVAAYHCIKSPGRHTYSSLYQQDVYMKKIGGKLPKPKKAI